MYRILVCLRINSFNNILVGLIFNFFIYASDKSAQAIIQKDFKKKHKVKNEEEKKALKAQK